MNDIKLQKVEYVTDLGVIVNSNLNWYKYIETCTKKANKRLFLVKRTLGFNVNYKVKLMCYKTLVRPLLEYCSNIWSPVNKKYLNLLESIQRKASKYILNDFDLNYKARLIELDLLPLCYRRDILDIVLIFNAINDLSDLYYVDFIKSVDNENIRLVNNHFNLKYTGNPPRTELLFNNYFLRVVNSWNMLPVNVKCMDMDEEDNNKKFKKAVQDYYVT